MALIEHGLRAQGFDGGMTIVAQTSSGGRRVVIEVPNDLPNRPKQMVDPVLH